MWALDAARRPPPMFHRLVILDSSQSALSVIRTVHEMGNELAGD